MRAFTTTSYRVPTEHLILVVTITAVLLVIGLTATATVCLSVFFIIGMVVLSYNYANAHHKSLLAGALRVSEATSPQLAAIVNEAAARLQVEPVEVFIAPSRELNAYAFGLSSPKAVVIYAALVKAMDRDELLYIIGHEIGHVRLGHTWLNSLVGGLAGIPTSIEASILLMFIFRWWNRACELSADRAGLLVCANPEKAISALIKLHAGSVRRPITMEEALQDIESEDDTLVGVMSEVLNTHPMIVRRIELIRQYAASPEYKRLVTLMSRNTI
ncbi:MAG: M48 family peptidase [Chloroflexi bacterium]|nr:MAG: M48 family peptidase [Chloroflexota bacterium]